MPIPRFDANSVLPPHLGDPCEPTQLSPYPCTPLELCQRFATSPERRQILDGLLRFRELLGQAGFASGFQGLDGSFLEDVEARESRPPADLDVVTFFMSPDPAFASKVAAKFPILTDPKSVKSQYKLDHSFVNMAYNPINTVEQTRYWFGLFSHRRDGIWKGMLRMDLNTTPDDANAGNYLRSLP